MNMNDNILITIIIPFYNSEKYIENCLYSVINQSYTNLEIILINDGSTDNSGNICKRIKDNRIKYIDKINEGVSKSRNLGIKLSSGEYLCFIDSDDYIEKDYIQQFINHIKNDINIYIQGMNIIKNGIKCVHNYANLGRQNIYSIFKKNKLSHNGFACGKLYKKSFLISNNILFNANIKFSEDLIFILSCLIHTDSIYYIDSNSYNYIIRNNSASCKIYSFEAEYECYSTFKELLNNLSSTYKLNLIEIDTVQTTYSMLFARVRNSLYYNKIKRKERFLFYRNISKDEKKIIYNNRCINNIFIRIGYLLYIYNRYKIMDLFFYIMFKIKK